MAGPGRYSLDRLFHIRVPKTLVALTMAGVVAGVVLADRQGGAAQVDEPAPEEAVMEGPEGGEDRVVETRQTDEDAGTDQTLKAGESDEVLGDVSLATDATAASALNSI